jgi:hypothetical protein
LGWRDARIAHVSEREKTKKEGTRESARPLLQLAKAYFFFATFFFATFFFAAFAFFAIGDPSLRWRCIASCSPSDPAHSAAWHVGPGGGVSRFAG